MVRGKSNDVAMSKHDVKEWMQRHNMSAEEMADWLGMTKQGVLHWLSGKREIPEPIGRLLNYFDLRPERMKDF